jgi:hypothetical protein
MPIRSPVAILAALLLAAPAFAQYQMGPRLSPGGIPVLDNPPSTATNVLAPADARADSVPATDILVGTPAKTGSG